MVHARSLLGGEGRGRQTYPGRQDHQGRQGQEGQEGPGYAYTCSMQPGEGEGAGLAAPTDYNTIIHVIHVLALTG